MPCRYGIRGLVIDPYNELDHQRDRSVTETEYVSKMLTKIKRFAQMNEVHVWFVAHPRQMMPGWKGEPPGTYACSDFGKPTSRWHRKAFAMGWHLDEMPPAGDIDDTLVTCLSMSHNGKHAQQPAASGKAIYILRLTLTAALEP